MDPSQSHQASEMHRELMSSFEELRVLLQTTTMPMTETTASHSKNSKNESSNTMTAESSAFSSAVHDLWKKWEENKGIMENFEIRRVCLYNYHG